MVKLLGASCVRVEDEEQRKLKGKVMLVKKNVLGVTDVGASILDRLYEIFGKGVSFRLISATHSDHARGKGKLGKESYLKDWVSKFTSLAAEEEVTFDMNFEWHESLGIPGAITIQNNHHSQFYLKAVAVNIPGHGKLHFICNSWIYPAHRYNNHRIFFSNKAYLPGETPEPLRSYREEALISLRGEGSGMLKEWDRVYDYAYYNDLGNPDKGQDYARPVLGGSKEYPYPRRGRTGRPTNRTDPTTESRLPVLSLDIYVPSDERFSDVKFSDFIAYALKSVGQVIVPEIKALFDKTINEFDSFQDVINLYEGGIKLPDGETLDKIRKRIPFEFLRELLRSDEDKTAWRTDEEFGREMLAGVNPVVIRQLLEFPPKSRLDRRIYGNQDSIITKDHIEKNMNGLTVDQAIKNNKMFILDHHDPLMPFLRRINTTTTKTYASRTLLLLQDDGTLKPLAIELSLPHEDGDAHGSVSDVYTPSPFDHGVESSIWQLAKAYAAVNDSGYHQLISHWTHTHAVIEPIVIATNRQLSVMHPIHKLLKPHFRDTMHINGIARQLLINAGGLFENTVFQGRYAFEISSFIYRTWNFTEQALPQDLIKRGMAVPDSSQPYGLRLMIEDYPYAVDGLEIWSAIEAWVKEYCSLYYSTDDKIREDTELQSWWQEVREEGHSDLQHEPWWPKLHTLHELVHSCTTIIWIASALHAAVNFGQYPYAGYMPNRPTVSRRLMPKRGTSDFVELETNPDGVFLKTVTSQLQTLLGISLIELLSRHSVDEIYLGQSDTPEWTADDPAKEAFRKFGETLLEIEARIMERNEDSGLKNRFGTVKMAYTLLYPDTSNKGVRSGLTGKGIPNSISM